jgi:glycosyltransferase involved in cell wall biosynthesis
MNSRIEGEIMREDGKTGRNIRVLFVCFADSSHAHSWMNLLENSDVTARAFAVMVLGDGLCGGMYAPLPWRQPIYVSSPPLVPRKATMVRSMFPNFPGMRRFSQWAESRWDLKAHWLRRTILRWKPHVIHSLATRPAGVFTWQVLSGLAKNLRPKWMVSAWGSDLNLGLDMPDVRPGLEAVLRNCDGFIPDCRRDLGKALRAGLDPSKVLFHDPLPGNAGFSPDQFPLRRTEAPKRDIVMVMKAFNTGVNDVGKVLQAIQQLESNLAGYEIHLMMCSPETRLLVQNLSESLRERIHCHAMLAEEPFAKLLGRARVVIAPSTSDGTPISMVEAMGVGAIPLFSPLESIKDWIPDGVNGVLAEAGDVDGIRTALHRALSDDELFHRAARINRALVLERANRDIIRQRMLDCYRSFAFGTGPAGKSLRAA